MRDADEIVRQNALRFIEDAQASARKEGRELDLPTIAGRMAVVLAMPKKSVSRQLNRYLREGHTWRIDYVEALGSALGKPVLAFVTPQDQREDEKEAVALAQSLYDALNHRLRPKETRDLVRRLHRLLDHRPLYDLTQRLSDLILEAPDQATARLEVQDAMAKSAAWDGKRTDLRGKKIGDKKSK